GNVLGDGRGVRRLRGADANVVAVPHLVTGLGGLVVDGHPAGVDDALHDGPAEVGEDADEVLVEPNAVHAQAGDVLDDLFVGGRGQFDGGRGGHGCSEWDEWDR